MQPFLAHLNGQGGKEELCTTSSPPSRFIFPKKFRNSASHFHGMFCAFEREKELDFGYAIISGKFANIPLFVICSVFLRYTLYDFTAKRTHLLIAQNSSNFSGKKQKFPIMTHFSNLFLFAPISQFLRVELYDLEFQHFFGSINSQKYLKL